jgi:hypothetical protein
MRTYASDDDIFALYFYKTWVDIMETSASVEKLEGRFA